MTAKTPETEAFLTAATDYRETQRQFDATVEMFKQHPTPGALTLMATWAGYVEAAYRLTYNPIYASPYDANPIPVDAICDGYNED